MMALRHGGLVRRAQLGVVPPDWKEYAPIPIVLVLHDERRSAEYEMNLDPFQELPYSLSLQLLTLLYPGLAPAITPPRPSPAPTFLLVVPEGLSLGRIEGDVGEDLVIPRNPIGSPHCGWNSGHRGFDGATLQVDDVGFIEALITELQEKFTANLQTYDPAATAALDLSRIYVAGVGNGGEMAYRLACELPTKPAGYAVRAIAVIGGSVGGKSDSSGAAEVVEVIHDPGKVVPQPAPPDVLIVHGMLDSDFVPYPTDTTTDPSDALLSRDEFDKMANEVNPEFVFECTPSSFGVEHSRDLWVDWIAGQVPLTNRLPIEASVERLVWGSATPSPIPGGPTQWARLPVRARQYVFEELPPTGPIPQKPNPYSPRYLTTVLDDALGHDVPMWDLGLLVWESFDHPAMLLP